VTITEEPGNNLSDRQPESEMQKPVKKPTANKAVIAIAIICALVMLIPIVVVGLYVTRVLIARKDEPGPDVTIPIHATISADDPEQTVPGETDPKHFSIEDATKLPDVGSRKAMSTVEIASKVSPATVSIVAEVIYGTVYGDTTLEASGSGFIISEDGYIVTNYHVVSGASGVSVVVPGFSDPFPAVLVGTDNRMDIAVLKIESEEKFPQMILGDSDLLQVGELAVAIGNPFGEFAGTVTVGVISAVNRELDIEGVKYNLLQTDASINNGNSGGPLVNSYGEVVGVTNAKMNSAEGIGFAIPINDVKSIIEELINKGYVSGRPILGVTVVSVDASIAEQFGWPSGLYVRDVTKDGPADQAGLIPEDIITHVNGQEMATTTELLALRDTLAVGDKMEMTVYRDGETVTLTLVLGEGKLS
jgi:serine protease Do